MSSYGHYREFLNRYAADAKKRRPGFSLSGWAKSLGLKSTSSLTKVLNGEREAGPELVDKLVRYFRFSKAEESQFRNLVALSKLDDQDPLKTVLFQSLERSQLSAIKSRLLSFDQFELLSSWKPLAIRELTRLSGMKIAKLKKLLPELTEETIAKSLALLSRLQMVGRDNAGHFVATDDSVHTQHEVPSEAIKAYHRDALDLAKRQLDEVAPELRDFQSLVLLVDSERLQELKEKLRSFLDAFEASAASSKQVDRLYQIQFQFFPVSKAFEKTNNPNLKKEVL